MVPYDSLWFLMVPYGSLWFLMVPYGPFLRVPFWLQFLGPLRLIYFHKGPYGFLRVGSFWFPSLAGHRGLNGIQSCFHFDPVVSNVQSKEST